MAKIGNEFIPPEMYEYFRNTFPNVPFKITFKEAWLRIVFMEALAGRDWACNFIADRLEGRVKDQNSTEEGKALLLSAIDRMVK